MTTYRIWRDDADRDPPDERTAESPQAAAELQAADDHDGPRVGWEWDWPVVYIVEDIATGARSRWEVDRELVPSFRAWPTNRKEG